MNTYHKIETVYKRELDGNRNIIEGQYSIPEFEMLKDITWVWTEKIDGTNIRIMPDKDVIRFGGKTDRAQIPTPLLDVLQDTFTLDNMQNVFKGETDICLYGEGYGKKIQKGGNYIPDGNNFILFDIRVGKWWLTRETCEDIAEQLEIPIVPIINEGTLLEAVEYVKVGFKSTIAHNTDYEAEGLVMKPKYDLFARNGKRIISKIKHTDFK